VIAEFGGYYAPHHRNYGLGLYDSVAECLEISRSSGAPLHLTHCHVSHPSHHGRASDLLNVLDDASAEGIEVTLDSYPYLAGMTYLHALLPSWVQSGGMQALGDRLRDTSIQEKVMDALDVTGTDGGQGATVNWANVVIAGVELAENKWMVGMNIAEIASKAAKPPSRLYLELLLAEDFKASMVTFGGNEENVRTIMQHPSHMAGSDGILHGDRPHPRAYGTFARYLGHYANQEKIITLEGAVARMTGRPATRLGLKDRGFIKEGYRADLVLFDPLTVKDQATYDAPRTAASGFIHVWIDGWMTLADGKRTSLTPGRAIRRGIDS
jgi:N-acyl-D-amino-acid deacylase